MTRRSSEMRWPNMNLSKVGGLIAVPIAVLALTVTGCTDPAEAKPAPIAVAEVPPQEDEQTTAPETNQIPGDTFLDSLPKDLRPENLPENHQELVKLFTIHEKDVSSLEELVKRDYEVIYTSFVNAGTTVESFKHFAESIGLTPEEVDIDDYMAYWQELSGNAYEEAMGYPGIAFTEGRALTEKGNLLRVVDMVALYPEKNLNPDHTIRKVLTFEIVEGSFERGLVTVEVSIERRSNYDDNSVSRSMVNDLGEPEGTTNLERNARTGQETEIITYKKVLARDGAEGSIWTIVPKSQDFHDAD